MRGRSILLAAVLVAAAGSLWLWSASLSGRAIARVEAAAPERASSARAAAPARLAEVAPPPRAPGLRARAGEPAEPSELREPPAAGGRLDLRLIEKGSGRPLAGVRLVV